MKIAEDIALYRKRRERLAQAMGAGVAVVPTAPERIRNRDTHYPYRFDSHFYYLTGFTEPEAVLVIVAGAALAAGLWRGGRWWSRALTVLALVPLGGAVWMARTNIFERMFAPLRSPQYARTAEATWVKDGDLVLGVEQSGEAVAYPVRQVAYHHVIMDEVGGVPVAATY
jgi:Xaa-Pro aminopeptidase